LRDKTRDPKNKQNSMDHPHPVLFEYEDLETWNQPREANVEHTDAFFESLKGLMDGAHNLFNAAKEQPARHLINGEHQIVERGHETGFQASRQMERPQEFLQTLLDLLRAQYEPYPMGTMFLNANIGFLYSNIPQTPFILGYSSITTDAAPFASIWNDAIINDLKYKRYNIKNALSSYVVVSANKSELSADLVSDVLSTLDAGFTSDDVTQMFVKSLAGENSVPPKEFYAGFCNDESLKKEYRISIWMIIDPSNQGIPINN